MKKYAEMTLSERQAEYAAVKAAYEQQKALGLKLNMARGKPCRDQLDMVTDIFNVLIKPEDFIDEGVETRNYGEVAGIPSAKALFADILGCKPEQVFVGGNASLQLMYDAVSKAFTHGLLHSEKPWCKLDKVKWICPVPGYDRHFKVTQSFGVEMINVPMTADGPDMDKVEELVKDPAVKGMWNVPKYSNPEGVVYSAETIRRLAAMKPAAPDFMLMWDNAYCIHEFDCDYVDFPDILSLCAENGNADMVYDLTDEELKKLTSNSIKEVPVVQRLELLNGIIKDDFADKILMDTLNSKERIDLHLHPELEQELQQRQQQDEERLLPLEEDETVRRDVLQGDAMVRGEDLALINENKGWYREGAHGREVKVGDIMVEKVPPMEGDKKGEDKYRMTAIINGEAITHEIKQKDYDKFLAVDDYHRMKLFSKVFSEVDMKTRPETNAGLGTKILAALTAGAVVTAEVAHDISHHHHHPAPEFYAEHHGGPRPYFKPGVDSPQEIAARYFEAEANHVATEIRRGY